MPENTYSYLPWVRQGLVGVMPEQLPPGSSPLRLGLTVKVRLNEDEAHDVQTAVRLYGPGDVTGFDAREVIRTEPVHLTSDFEPNYLAAVEFDRPDFPWLFTPAPSPAGSEPEQLKPWICLVVVEKEKTSLRFAPEYPLPVLTIQSASELPDLAQSWAWAHAQVTGATEQDRATVLANKPERTLSRLVCPRRLEPNKSYYACVVPTFEAGRRAGLNQSLDRDPPQRLTPAWNVESLTASDEVTLPLYYHWEFATGAAGDFESLVWLLEARTDLPNVGVRQMNVDSPGFGLPGIGKLPLEGALRPGQQVTTEPNRGLPDFQRDLVTLLNNEPGTELQDLPMPPPIYGRWHAGQSTVSIAETGSGWPDELNVNPQYRVAAGLGTRLVQDQQEQLMAAAWEQVDQIERANQALRQAQLARETIASIRTKHFQKMPAERLLQITGPLHTRVLMSPHTVEHRIRQSPLPTAAVSTQTRRITRPRGPFSRRLGPSDSRQPHFIQRLASAEIKVVPPPTAVEANVRMDAVFQALGRDQALLTSAAPARLQTLLREPTLSPARKAFSEAALVVQQRLSTVRQPMPPPPPPSDTLLRDIQTAMLGSAGIPGQLEPSITIVARMKKRLQWPPTWNPKDNLEPIMAAPEFLTPMYRPLANLSQDWLLPGVEHVPPNTICLLEPNAKFIEAFMIGLNHEMGRELLWREYPSDQRGTYFPQFWSARVQLPGPPAQGEPRDIQEPIHRWGHGTALGSHLRGTANSMVLLIRGELLQRYPRASIYAARGEWIDNPKDPNLPKVRHPRKDHVSFPVFEGTLPPDLTFLGFVIEGAKKWRDITGSVKPADGNPGWFIVIQQQPTEPRFGLDKHPPPPEMLTGTWRDLSWDNVELQRQHINLDKPLLLNFQRPTKSPDDQVAWGTQSDSAALAYITQQDPFRLAIHASRLALHEREPE